MTRSFGTLLIRLDSVKIFNQEIIYIRAERGTRLWQPLSIFRTYATSDDKLCPRRLGGRGAPPPLGSVALLPWLFQVHLRLLPESRVVVSVLAHGRLPRAMLNFPVGTMIDRNFALNEAVFSWPFKSERPPPLWRAKYCKVPASLGLRSRVQIGSVRCIRSSTYGRP